MPTYCAAYRCSEGFKKGGQYTFHSFPKDEERRKKWVIALRRENFQPSNSSRICSKHFHDECFDREKFGGTWLKSDAIPTLFDFPSHLQKTPITRKPPTKRSFADEAPDKREDSLPSGDEPTKKKQKVYRYPGDFNETELASPTKCKAALDLANNALQIKMLKQTKRPFEKVVSLDSMVKLEFIGETAPPGTGVREGTMSLIKEEIKTEDELFDSSQDPELQGSCSQVKLQLIGETAPPVTGVWEETMSLIKEEIKTEDELFDASENPELQGPCSQLKFEFIEVKDEAGKLTWKDYHSVSHKPILEGKPQLIGEMENKYENPIGDLGKNTDYFGSMSVDNLNKTLSPMHSFDDNPIGLSLCENRFRPTELEDTNLVQKPKPYKCIYCARPFSHRHQLKNHILSVHKKFRPNKCPRPNCKYTSASKGDLSIHIKSVHEKRKRFQCPLCDFSFSRKEILSIHWKVVHEKLKDFKCSSCDYACSTKARLKSHIKSHEQFKCSSSDYASTLKGNLSKHIKAIHAKVKDFLCPNCDYEGSTKRNLLSHIKVHKKIKPCDCPNCDFVFASKSELSLHIKPINEKLKEFICPNCDYRETGEW